MLQPIYVTCPRGHRHKAGRVSPGLAIRVRGSCPQCGDAHVSSGVVTPFSSELVLYDWPHLRTGVSRDSVLRSLNRLGGRPGVQALLRKLHARGTDLVSHEVIEATELWVRYHGRRGAALADPDQRIAILDGTDAPQASADFLKQLVLV